MLQGVPRRATERSPNTRRASEVICRALPPLFPPLIDALADELAAPRANAIAADHSLIAADSLNVLAEHACRAAPTDGTGSVRRIGAGLADVGVRITENNSGDIIQWR